MLQQKGIYTYLVRIPKFLRSGQSDILVSVEQYKHGVASPPRGARSGGHDSCQAARTTATCHDLEEERAAMGQRLSLIHI